MRSLVALVRHPERRRPGPAPLKVDLRVTILVGMAIWAVAMVVTGVLAAVDVVAWRVPTVCAAGLGLGVVALAWERKHRIEYRGD